MSCFYFKISSMAPLLLFSFIAVLCGRTSHAANLTPKVYWDAVLPNTPMPASIYDLLYPPAGDEETRESNADYLASVNFPPICASATPAQLRDQVARSFFFLESSIFSGANRTMQFMRASPCSADLLPRRVADAIPFSAAKLPDVLALLSVDPASREAQEMRQTLERCEEPPAAGEAKRCATSLESMVDFAVSALGTKDARAASTVASRAASPMQRYAVGGFRSMAEEPTSVICHAVPYAYAVFHCHATGSPVRAYAVPMTGCTDGNRVEAAAVCHEDTSSWNPSHLAFQVLGVKPGGEPVCHFLPYGHVLWIPGGHEENQWAF